MVQINGVQYDVLRQLSLPHRGRWKVRDRKGRLFTVIDVLDSPSARQFKNSLSKLKKSVTGIPEFVDFEQADGRLRMVVSWCEGPDLESYFSCADEVRRFQPSVWESVRRIKPLAHLCKTLHQRCRIIHGDIKPPNLILPSDPGSIAIIDFGSSWQIEQTHGRADGDGADIFYSAPEVFQQSAKVDSRADQFSIAVVLFRMMFGDLPYAGNGGQAGDPRFRNRFEDKLDIPSKDSAVLKIIPDSIRIEIETLLRRSLSLSPDGRFPSSVAFAKALDSIYDKLKLARSLKPSDYKQPSFVAEIWRKLRGA
jgi:serine/threonine protein kinase